MTTIECINTARYLMDKYGLSDWKIRINSSNKISGACNFKKKTLTFSRKFIECGSTSDTYDTILHEIAHALTYNLDDKNYHGDIWRKVFIEIGGSGEKYYKGVTPKAKYEAVCSSCGKVYKLYRLPTRNSSCTICHPKGFNSKYLLKVEKRY